MRATEFFKKRLFIRFSFSILVVIFVCSNSFAFQLAELQSETAADLLLFFEEEELIIATRHATPVRKAPAIATVITAKEIRNMGARNLLDILRRVPGIGVSISDVPTLHAIEARGIRTTLTEKVLIMIDGHRMNNAQQGSAILTFGELSVEHIKRVEVIRGPGSALYGANAFVAVINVVTKDTGDIKGYQLTAGGGSFNTKHYNILIGQESDKLKITGFFDYYDTNGPSSHIEQDTIGASGDTLEWQEKTNIGLNISYGDFSLRGGYARNKMGPYIGVASALNDETVQDWSHAYADLVYKRKIADEVNMTMQLYGNLYRGNPHWQILPDGFPGYPDGMIGKPTARELTYGGEISSDYSISEHLITVGFMYENDRQYDIKHVTNFNPNTNAPIGPVQDISDWGNYNKNVDRDIWAVYIQDVWNITNEASLTAGLRHDNYSDFGGTTNPRVGFVWEFIKNTSLKLLYGSAFRAPSFTQLYQRNNPVNKGNPELESETIQTYEAGFEHRFLENHTVRVNYFYNKLNDLIVSGEKPSATEPAVFENTGESEVSGIEAELLFDLRSDYYGYVNYSYQDAKDSETDKKLPDVPSHRANAGINLAPWKYLNANINLSWTGKRPRAEGDTRDDLSSQTLVDLTLIAKNFYKTLEIRGSVYNLFDEDYRDPSPFPVKVPNDYPTNDRMFMVEARYTF